MAKTQAQKNRAIRQEELRAKLSAQGHLQHVVENISKINKLDETSEHFKNGLDKLKASTDYNLKLVNKYLPDLKNTEITGDGGSSLTIQVKNFADKDTE